MRKLNTILGITISLVFFALYSFRLENSFLYHADFARDIFEILKISQGDLVLLGPKLSFGGLYSGPYYFYLFVPIYSIFRSIASVLYFNAFLFSAFLFYFFHKASRSYSLPKVTLSTISFGLLPLFMIGARGPSNAYTFIPFLFTALTFIYFDKPQDKIRLFLLGLLLGIILNFHFVNAIIIFPLFVLIFMLLKVKNNIWYLILGAFLSFAPLVLFELKHNFIMLKNTFIEKSYLSWVGNKNIAGGEEGKKNIFANIVFMSEQLGSLIVMGPLFLFIFVFEFLKRKKPKSETRLLYLTSLFAFVLFSFIMRFQFTPFYLTALACLIFFSAVIVFLEYDLYYLLIFFILFSLFTFPRGLYTRSPRSAQIFEKRVKYVVNHKLVNKNESFNIAQITEGHLLATLGYEYRYFFRKYGYIPLSEFEYNKSKTLIIFSERPDEDISKLGLWEIDQFGKEHLKEAKKHKAEKITIYKVSK